MSHSNGWCYVPMGCGPSVRTRSFVEKGYVISAVKLIAFALKMVGLCNLPMSYNALCLCADVVIKVRVAITALVKFICTDYERKRDF